MVPRSLECGQREREGSNSAAGAGSGQVAACDRVAARGHIVDFC
jgi:hypothetical protein